MKNQNSQFDNLNFGYGTEGEQIPDYSYSKKELRRLRRQQRRQERRQRRHRRNWSFFGICLCVVLSFTAAFCGFDKGQGKSPLPH